MERGSRASDLTCAQEPDRRRCTRPRIAIVAKVWPASRLDSVRPDSDRGSVGVEQLALPVAAVRAHVLRALAGVEPPVAVRWRDGDAAVVVHADQAEVHLGDGWLAVDVPMACDQAARQLVHAVFHLGAVGAGDGAGAAFALDPSTAPTIAGRWGTALRDRIWDAVLDVLEAAALAAAPGGGGRVVGFACTEDALVVEVDAP